MIQIKKKSHLFFIVIFLAFASPAKAQLIGDSQTYKNNSPWSIEIGLRYSFHYNMLKGSILTPPKILYANGELDYMVADWLQFYTEFGASINSVTSRSVFIGAKIIFLQAKLSRKAGATFKSVLLSVNIDYGVISLSNPPPPDIYIPAEFLGRVGASMLLVLGKGKKFIDVTGLLYNESDSNLMASFSINFGFLFH